MRKLLTFGLIIAVTLCLGGCCGNVFRNSGGRPRVVTCVTVSRDNETRTYTSDDSMEAVLAYLRLLSPVYTADPVSPEGPFYRIRLIFSDGSHREYSQQGCRFREGDGEWVTVTDRDSLALCKLFDLLEPETTLSPK